MASFRSSSHGEVRKINIVYFLSRGGQVEHPHLLKVYPVVQSRVRLRDIKRWLAKVRGKDMPDAFSWSYKRRYKTGYVWQDLCDDDLVTPMSDNEYILKGSEIFPSCKDKYKADGSEEQRNSLDLEEIQDENQVLNNGSKLLLELDLSTSQENYAALKESRSADFSKSSVWNHHHQPPDKCYSFNEDYKLAVEYITKLNGGTPSITSNDSGEVIRVYKAVTSSASVPIMDAEAQTGESQRMISENEEAGKPDSSSEVTQEINPVSSPKKQPPGNYEGQVFQEQLLSSPKITADNHEPRVAGELRGGSLRNKPEQSKESRDSRCEPVTPMSLEPSKSRMRENILSNGTALQVGRQNSKNDESSSEKLRSSDAELAEKTVISEPKFQGKLHKSYSKLSCVRNDVAVAFTESSQASPKTKKPAASQMLKQLFTCGSTETKPSGARSLKSLTLPRTFSNDSRNSTPRASDLQATTPKAGTPTKREHAVKLEPKLNDKTGDDCSDDETQSLCKCRMPGRRSSSSAKITGNIVPGQA